MTDLVEITSDAFYSELYRDDDPTENTLDDNKNVCLISHEVLSEHYQTLTCGHTFNYIPLYSYIYNYKYTYGRYGPKFKVSEFKCPYCRCVQYNLIPYIPIGDIIETFGVNVDVMFKIRDISCMYVSKKNIQCSKNLLRQRSPTEFYCLSHFDKNQRKKDIQLIKPTVSVITPIDYESCKYVFVKGKCKGTSCGGFVVSDLLCKKHLHTLKPKIPLP
jgi:hypothetical protein